MPNCTNYRSKSAVLLAKIRCRHGALQFACSFTLNPVKCVQEFKIEVVRVCNIPGRGRDGPIVPSRCIEVVIQDVLDNFFTREAKITIGRRRLNPIEKCGKKTQLLDDL